MFENWNGFNLERFTLNGADALIVYPKEGTANGKWMLKTEYFGAFPDAEIKLLEKGYHLAHIQTKTRWHIDSDDENKKVLCESMHNEKGLSKKCVPVGMSCGGMQAIYFAAKYPEYVSCLYIDAPVVNLLSCPGCLGKNKSDELFAMRQQMLEQKGLTFTQLLSYREHPLDYLDKLVSHKIPMILVSGDSDTVVDFEENGLLVKQAYEKAGIEIETYIKPGGNHHPHGLFDNTPIVEFILKHDK